MVPVDIAVHLIFREQERFERREPLCLHADPLPVEDRIVHKHQGVQQAVFVDLAIWHAAHQRVALEVVHFIEIE